MSVSFIRAALNKGVGKRIFLMFMLAAVVPMLLTASLAYFEFDRGLKNEAAKSLGSSADYYGIDILTRMQEASYKADELLRVVEQRGILAVREHDYLLDDFESVWVIGDAEAEAAAGPVAEEFKVSEERLDAVKAGLPNLVVTPSGELVLLKAAGNYVFGSPILALHLAAEVVWGASENLPYNTEFCVFGSTGSALYCSIDIDSNIHAALMAEGERKYSSQFGEWSHNGEAQFAILSALPLRGSFGADRFDIVAMQPKSFALQAGTDFRRIFVPVLITVFVLVGILTMYLVAQNLGPLQHLTIAARQIASGNLSSRVRVKTNDEFELLARAFNNMADRLGRQIATLEAMSGIDRLILTGTKLEEVSEDVVGHLMTLTGCSAAGVIARDADNPIAGAMISLHAGAVRQERIPLPEDIDERWFHAQQADLSTIGPAVAPYSERFKTYGNKFVVLIPVLLQDKLKGALLLGFDKRYDMSHASLLRCIDLAGRFAVALASVEREEALYRQAHFDQLTGLPNRQLMKDTLAQYLANARRNEQAGALLFLDLDRFKEINDVFGHSVGDAVLTQAAQRIVSVVRDRDAVARLGGDEFVVILPDVRNDKTVRATAERLLDRLAEAFTVSDIDHYVSASIGIAMFPEDGSTVDTVLKNADAAMYRAKDAGRSRYEFFSKQLNAESRRKIGIERDLRTAFNTGELECGTSRSLKLSLAR